jgi:tetratricopeptide (TPR) repeat protein
MRKTHVAAFLCVAIATLPLTGCNKVKARAEMKKGNRYYKDEAYKDALAQFQKSLSLDPALAPAWRSVGLTAMALYRPGNDSPANIKYAETALEAFTNYLKANPHDSKTEDYLVTTWINLGRFDDAIKYLKQQRSEHPETAKLSSAVVTVMIKAGRYQDALDFANTYTRNDAPMYYLVATNAWSKSYNDPTTAYDERVGVVEIGLKAVQRACEIKADYMEAMVYYNLLYREKAKLDLDPKKKDYWNSLADEWRSKAMALMEKRKASSPAQPPATKTAS